MVVEHFWFWIVGCVGMVLIVTTGKIFFPLRIYLRGFSVAYNPFRILGDLISCPMCLGWWVGFLWTLLFDGFAVYECFLWGGIVSMFCYVSDELLLFFELLVGERPDERTMYVEQRRKMKELEMMAASGQSEDNDAG
jgi:hypothetical protein